MAALGLCATSVNAEILTFGMSGQIESITGETSLIDDDIQVGDPYTFTFTFDSDAVDQNPTPTLGFYDGIAASLTIDDQTPTLDPPLITVQSGAQAPSLALFQVSSLLDFGPLYGSAVTSLSGSDGTVLLDDALPSEPLDPNLFETRWFRMVLFSEEIGPGGYPLEVQADGTLDAFFVVPEPSLAAGMFLSLARVRP